jgi:hypothetical protein
MKSVESDAEGHAWRDARLISRPRPSPNPSSQSSQASPKARAWPIPLVLDSPEAQSTVALASQAPASRGLYVLFSHDAVVANVTLAGLATNYGQTAIVES